jgi:multiple sugar transport system substrate-binding protein
MKRIVSIVGILFLSLTVVSMAAVTQLTMVYWPGPESDAMQQVVNYWNNTEGASLGIKVSLLNFSRESFWDKETAMLKAHSSIADIAYVSTYSLGNFVNYLVPFEQPLTSEISNSFIPSAVDSMSYNGKIYGVPLDVSIQFLFYRKDLLNKLLTDKSWQETYSKLSKQYIGEALLPKPPQDWNWKDYEAMAIFFTKKYNPSSPTEYGNVLQMENLIYNVMIWDDVLWSYGGSWFNKNGQFDINTPAASEAALLYKNLYQLGTTPPDSTSYEFGEANQIFQAGKAFMMIQWNAAYPILTDKQQSPLVWDKVGITHIPGPRPSTHVHTLGVALSKYSLHKDAALKFLSFLTTEKAIQMYAENGGMPPSEVVLQGMADSHPEYPEVANDMKKYGFVESTSEYTMGILQELANELTAIWTNQISIENGLQKVQKDVEFLMQQ